MDPEVPGFSLRTEPDVIIPVGEKALGVVGLSGITKLAGQVLEYNGVPVVPVFGPEYIEKNKAKGQ